MGFFNCSMFCCALLCVHSSFAIILMEERELAALRCLSLPHDAMGLLWYFLIILTSFGIHVSLIHTKVFA